MSHARRGMEKRSKTAQHAHLGLVRHGRLGGKLDGRRIQNRLLRENLLLTEVVAKRPLPKQHLVQNHTRRPHVDLGRDWRRRHLEALGRQVPVRAGALRRQLERARVLILNDLGQAKVGDFHLAATS